MPSPRTRKIFLIIIVLIVSGVLIWKLTRPRLSQLERQRLTDIQTLHSEMPAEDDYFGAITRLAQEQNPLARQVALKNLHASSEKIQEGSILALGYFDEIEALDALEKISGDLSPTLAQARIRAIGYRDGERRRRILKQIADRHDISDPEKIAALSVRLVSREDPNDQ
ncbi:MAG: hypothetical protein ABIO95_12520, partial [Bdellovibrionota bacterium]